MSPNLIERALRILERRTGKKMWTTDDKLNQEISEKLYPEKNTGGDSSLPKTNIDPDRDMVEGKSQPKKPSE